ncbi:MAG: OmpA domain protein transrane region-containing protein [Tardiphaga sp.]|jgi:outer membrane immunogenic protein|uniref:outer membrane protein n=1 Tax=Tardiphaga sp. TaxID=1926292 RepID=UPI002614040B|nr:outer membrane protein [Tardiphaga sp.]MDB5502545.1 OmpA domain protein transrane region-containing protein [Tardiphaga sp.]
MKNFLLGTVALIALTATASAADLAARPYTKAPAYVAAPIYNWTGFYIGGHVGGAFSGNNGFAGVSSSNNDGQFMGGVQGGYDYQFAPNWVFGVEANYSWTGNNNNAIVFPAPNAAYSFTSNLKGIGSVTGRVGYTWGPALLYVKGGYAYADLNRSVVGPTAIAINGNKDGYTVGAGLEYLFTQNWSGKVEYQYYDFGKTSFGTAPLVAYGSTRNDEHTVKAGLNYRFNLGGPILAKY